MIIELDHLPDPDLNPNKRHIVTTIEKKVDRRVGRGPCSLPIDALSVVPNLSKRWPWSANLGLLSSSRSVWR